MIRQDPKTPWINNLVKNKGSCTTWIPILFWEYISFEAAILEKQL